MMLVLYNYENGNRITSKFPSENSSPIQVLLHYYLHGTVFINEIEHCSLFKLQN